MSFGPKDIVRDQLSASVIQIEREKTMKGSSQSQPGCAPKSATSGSEPSAADDRLTAHFSLREMCVTQHREFDNTPPPEVVGTLRNTAARMEAVRRLLGGRVISVSSGYRCPALNRAVGGARTSAHLTGHAVDFNCYGFGDPLAVCRVIAESDLAFDQIIEEGTWVHISFDPRLRRQVLTRRPGGYGLGLPDPLHPSAADTSGMNDLARDEAK